MTDEPKRRGRPRKVRVDEPREPERAVMAELDRADAAEAADWAPVRLISEAEMLERFPPSPPYPIDRFRLKAGRVQQAWQHATGIQWRPLPVVAADAPDWEDS